MGGPSGGGQDRTCGGFPVGPQVLHHDHGLSKDLAAGVTEVGGHGSLLGMDVSASRLHTGQGPM